jgi:hypothetical protein
MSFEFALDSLSVGFDASLSVGVFFGLVVVHAEAARAAGLDGPQLHDHPLSYCVGYPMLFVERGILSALPESIGEIGRGLDELAGRAAALSEGGRMGAEYVFCPI